MKKQSANESKLKEMILYFSNLSEVDESFGSIKLNKLLFYADFTAYLRWGKSISGVRYFALEHGPAPQPMKRILKALESQKALILKDTDYYGSTQKKPIALSQPKLKCFNVEEVNLMHNLLNEHWGKNAKSISYESHGFLGWSALWLGEEIPYSVALVGTREPTLHEIAEGKKLESLALESLSRNAARRIQRNNRGRSI